jgi:hypothetical protein
MKKIVALITLAALLALALSPVALADPPAHTDRSIVTSDTPLVLDGANDENITYDPIGVGDDPIPVYGYVGLKADPEDPDPEDPSVEPTYTSKGVINVSVPVKIAWAAYHDATPAGDVTSPLYHVKNNSTDTTLTVAVHSFAASSTNPDNAVIDPDLTLDLKSTSAQLGTSVNLITATTPNPSLPVAAGSQLLPAPGAATPTIWDFTLGGTWAGTFGLNSYAPNYYLTLSFTLVP